MMKRLKKAFTITELVIVIAVIAILAAVLIPTFSHVVENANQSAALQTCRNALTEYQTMVTMDDDDDNDDTTGATFVYNGYAFVYVNSQLHYIGKVDSLTNIKGSDQSFDKRPNDGKIGGDTGIALPAATSDGKITASYTVNNTPATKKFDLNTLKIDKKTVDGQEVIVHNEENLYFYSIEINATTYNGYFTYEAGANPVLQLNGATYSRNAFIAGTAVTIA